MDELIGTELGDGRYRIESLLGGGGQATVYKGTHLTLKIPVAIKVLSVLSGQDRAMRIRFEREARRAATLRHPNIVSVHDYAFEADKGFYYIISDFFEGKDLKRYLADHPGPVPIDVVANYIGQVGDALEYAHKKNIIHRDIKPGNILVNEADGHVGLCDFGLARMTEGEDLSVTSDKGTTPGTPAYMSPEQCLAMDLDRRTDVYSLGVVVYEMLTGRNPFRGPRDTSQTTMFKHVHTTPPAPSTLNPELNPQVDATMLKALAKSPADRYATVSEFTSALGEASDGKRRRPAKPARPARRKGIPVWLPLVLGVAAIAVAFVFTPGLRALLPFSASGPTDAPVAVATTAPSPTPPPPPTATTAPPTPTVDKSLTQTGIAAAVAATSDSWATKTAAVVSEEAAARKGTEVAMADATRASAERATHIAQETEAAAVRETEVAAATEEILVVTRRAQAERTEVAAAMTAEAAQAQPIVVRVEGLDEWGRQCSTLVFFKGDEVTHRIPLEGRDQVEIPGGTADWLKFEGGPDGHCPWSKWTPTGGTDPDHTEIVGEVVILHFAKAGTEDGGEDGGGVIIVD